MNSIKTVTLLLVSVMLASCSYIAPSSYVQNRDKAFLKAKAYRL